MNCVELRESLAETEDGGSAEQRTHLKTCRECSTLVGELNLIASAAIELRAANEPSPRVWNSIEIALRQEGLIRKRRAGSSLLPTFGSRWVWARWMVPAAAALLIAVGIYLRQHSLPQQLAREASAPAITDVGDGADLAVAGLNDDDLRAEMAQQSPDLQAEYAEHLRHVNQSIQDAKDVVAANPDDEEARRSLMEAYQQKAMLFELALDRSLP